MDVIVILIALIVLLLYVLSTWKFNYWEKKNVPHLKPTPLLGNYGNYIFLRQTIFEVAQRICRAFPREPYVGTYYGTEPALIVQDPELIKLIIAKDFPYFNGREVSKYTDREILTGDLFFTYGDRWKAVRQSMSPLFTSSKLRNMFHLIEKCAHMFEDMLDRETSVTDKVEMRILLIRYTMDCICSSSFGVDVNTMDTKVGDNPFTKMGGMLFETTTSRGTALVTRSIWPAIFYGLRFKVFQKSITDFFNKVLTEVFEGRQYKPSARHDFVDMVLNIKKNDYIKVESVMNPEQIVNLKIDDELLVGQCVVLFAGGFETSATTLSFALYELAKNKEAQRRAITEVDEYLSRCEGKISYDCVNELPYLEACIDETLRLYPVLGMLTREVMADYALPCGLKLDKGVRVHLPVYHLHRNPEHFPEPEQFRPERFLPDAKHLIKPYTYLPFGEGPRICIGLRFAKMQMLPGLVTVLKKFEVELVEGMPRTVEFEPRALVTQSKSGINLKLVRRDGWEGRLFKK